MKKYLTVKNIAIVVLSIGCLIFLSRFLNGCKKVPPPPNKELIKYMEEIRKHYDTIELKLLDSISAVRQEANDREQRDSLTRLQDQNRLINSINSIKLKYAKIPIYTDISKDSLHRIINEH